MRWKGREVEGRKEKASRKQNEGGVLEKRKRIKREEKTSEGGKEETGKRGEERREASFGRESDDTAHPSRWQVAAVAPSQRTQTS